MLLFQIPLEQERVLQVHLIFQECHKPGLDLQATVPGKGSSSPEDEQEKQGQSTKDFTPCTKVIVEH
ncbi:hypothetical protein TNCV_987131 [Trichonephila clavipes]|nr:hypothetical protein TNCV_987131 [Trichonephila clavipes]